MKKLIFVRHGKAEDNSGDFPDYYRSLTPKGKLTCRTMARRLKETDPAPGLFISSPAFRALETAIIFSGVFSVRPEQLKLDDNVYHKMNFDYLTDMLTEIDDKVDSLILFGHNPGFTEIPDELCLEGCEMMPKTGIIGINFEINEWKDLRRHSGRTIYFLKPEKTS
jgi:phosphohistidine phosphatase